jgi:ABC-2 type transport system permease protein
MSSPIADLSYRNYNGPLEPPIYRWWAIAKATMRLKLKNKFLWFLAGFSGYWYLVLMAVFYFMESLAQNAPIGGGQNAIFSRIVWKDQFLNAFSISQFLLFLIALLIGVGSIANDNRANALLVYLSKPVSRLDYLIGKWVGIFIPLVVIAAFPTFIFYGYCFMSYRQYGFLTEDPQLFFKLCGMVLLPAFFHSSVSLGISSLFNQGRLAGATYAGIFFMSLFFTKAMQIVWLVTNEEDGRAPALVAWLYYCSIDGIQIALAKIILGTNGSWLFAGLGAPSGPNQAGAAMSIPAPPALPFWLAYFGISFLALFIAWSRVRAVEVVA